MEELKIAEKIKEKRRERNFTQEELANILGVTKAAVSKWENSESYPDITMLPKIAQLFNITMDELFGYTMEYRPLKVVNEYYFGITLDDVDKSILDHGTVKECRLVRNGRYIEAEDRIEYAWEVRIQIVSTEDDSPYTLQRLLKTDRLVDGYSLRTADGKIIYDDKPNKHYVCKEKVWEYNTADIKYMRQMFKELRAMGLLADDE